MTGYRSKVSMSAGVYHAPYIPKINPTKFFVIDPTVDKLPPTPIGCITLDVSPNVAQWLEMQPIHMWKFSDVPAYSSMMDRYIVSEKLYTMLALRWS